MTRFVVALALILTLSVPAVATPLNLRMCAKGERNTSTKTCIVDGDTIWLDGVNYRLEGYDTPEPQTNICGGKSEISLAQKASARLQELLASGDVIVYDTGSDGSYGRRLANITVDGRDIGEILVSERLARWWPNGHEWWCN